LLTGRKQEAGLYSGVKPEFQFP